jgi:hypothetical protein
MPEPAARDQFSDSLLGSPGHRMVFLATIDRKVAKIPKTAESQPQSIHPLPDLAFRSMPPGRLRFFSVRSWVALKTVTTNHRYRKLSMAEDTTKTLSLLLSGSEGKRKKPIRSRL